VRGVKGKHASSGSEEKKADVKAARTVEKAEVSVPVAVETTDYAEKLNVLKHQKEEIETLLSSLEDAYYEAAILEDDYNDTKEKNIKRLDEINRMIREAEEKVKKEESEKIAKIAMEEMPPAMSRSPASFQATAPAESPGPKIDLDKMEEKISAKFKEIASGIETRIGEKDADEIRKELSKYSMEIERIKVLVESIKEMRGVQDEKIQRALETTAELRSIVFQREASVRDQESRLQKMGDKVSQIEPEKILMALNKRDRELSDHSLRIDKMDGKLQSIEEMMSRLKVIITNIGSIETMVNMSRDSTQKLTEMRDVQNNMQKLSDKIHGLYADMSSRLEEFEIYRRKQDRNEALMDSMMRNIEDLTKRSGGFVTKEDLESLRMAMPAAGTGATGAGEAGLESLMEEKEEIEMLLKSMEESYKAAMIPKKEYEKTRQINMDKLERLKAQIKEAGSRPLSPVKAEAASPAREPPGKKVSPGALEDAFSRGLISRKSYEKVKKMVAGG
jgi:chromosome segregation ATPase